jgi:hypothetical protein
MALLGETGIDCWCTFVRETSEMCDPAACWYLVGADVVGEAAFLLARDGRAFAVLAAPGQKRCGGSLNLSHLFLMCSPSGNPFWKRWALLDPKTIGLNFSEENYAVDGLSYGMYRRLRSLLEGTPYADGSSPRKGSSPECGASKRRRNCGAFGRPSRRRWNSSTSGLGTSG